jgi:DNA-binding transcriptional regulator YiaG|tara:strand:+ start:220 stop:438 length:219 start_codon:yes stop_codon:yes gene_type:complete
MSQEKEFIQDVVEQFRIRRNELQIPQTELDDIIGCATGLVAKWETGNRKPTAFNLYCWAEALKCKITVEAIK